MGEGQIDVQHPDRARFRLESSRFTELIGQIMPSQILKGQRSDQHNEQPLSDKLLDVTKLHNRESSSLEELYESRFMKDADISFVENMDGNKTENELFIGCVISAVIRIQGGIPGLREFHRGIKLFVELGRRLVAWAIKLPCQYCSEVLVLGLSEFGQKFDGEAGNVCIKGDAYAQSSDAYATPDPGILRGRILARLRIKNTRRSSLLVSLILPGQSITRCHAFWPKFS
ncbi:hypothetical protein Bca101_025681 [Brassica carinata]